MLEEEVEQLEGESHRVQATVSRDSANLHENDTQTQATNNGDSSQERRYANDTSKTRTTMSDKQVQARRKLLALLAMHLQNFQRVILMSRHRFHQRMRRRQSLLRTFYVQQMLELETSFLEMLPLPGISDMPQPHEFHLSQSNVEAAPQNVNFYEHAINHYSEEQWLATFRMRRQTFELLCAKLRQSLRPSGVNAPLKNLISLEKRIALSLYAFASGNDYRSIATLFKISRASVCKFVHRFAEALLETLGSCLLAMPRNESEYSEIRTALQQSSNMPNAVVGVLGLCELSVTITTEEVKTFVNDAGSATIILQAYVDDKLLFRKVQLNARRPTLFLDAPNEITKLCPQQVNGRMLPCFVVTQTDCYYPLKPWLMQRYDLPAAPHELYFNESIDNLLQLKTIAFTRLFARWKILNRKCDLEPRTMSKIATACCALHNLLEENEEGFLEKWIDTTMDTSRFDTISCYQSGKQSLADERIAAETRDFLARTISSTEI